MLPHYSRVVRHNVLWILPDLTVLSVTNTAQQPSSYLILVQKGEDESQDSCLGLGLP